VSAASETRLQRILEAGELRVGMTGDLPPLNMKNAKGELIGLEVDLVTALADAMGLELRLVETPFAEILNRIESGDLDLGVSGLSITPQRNARVAFAGPYFISGMSVLSKSAALTDARNPEILDDPTRTYAALAESTSSQFVADLFPQAKLVLTQDYESAVQMVLDGEVDALMADHLACSVAKWRNPEAGLSSSVTPFTIEPLGIALPANAPLLLNLVENYLQTLHSTGLLTRFKARWLADGSWMAELR
jgi:polar amino acid transport system substrate-binding protein